MNSPTGPTLHPRTRQVNEAGNQIRQKVSEVSKTFDLTYAELLMILSDELQSYCCDAVKTERKV